MLQEAQEKCGDFLRRRRGHGVKREKHLAGKEKKTGEQKIQPDVCPTLPGRDDGDSSPRWPPDSVQLRRRQKPSVASMTFKGVALLAA
ncbi:unnamed protein product, partial [Nesidiocoris tenuis]